MWGRWVDVRVGVFDCRFNKSEVCSTGTKVSLPSNLTLVLYKQLRFTRLLLLRSARDAKTLQPGLTKTYHNHILTTSSSIEHYKKALHEGLRRSRISDPDMNAAQPK